MVGEWLSRLAALTEAVRWSVDGRPAAVAPAERRPGVRGGTGARNDRQGAGYGSPRNRPGSDAERQDVQRLQAQTRRRRIMASLKDLNFGMNVSKVI
jgi:hypothetical protein